MRTVALWRGLISLLWLRREALRTLQGRGLLLLLLIALPSLWELARTAAAPRLPVADGGTFLGALLLAHVLLTLTFAVLLPLLLYRDFVLRGREEPLLAHPWALPALTRVRVIGAVLWAIGYLLTFFYLFHFPLLRTPGIAPVRTALLHLTGSLAYYFALGLGLAAATFAVLRGRGLAGVRRAPSLFFLTFLALFSLTAVLPGIFQREVPAFLALLAEIGAKTLYLLQFPVALGTSVSPWERIGWGALLLFFALGVMGWALQIGWGAISPSALALGGEVRRKLPSAFARFPIWYPGSRVPRLFWQKDVLLPLQRTPLEYIGEQGLIATGGIGAVVLLVHGLTQGLLSIPQASTVASVLPLVGIAVLSGLRTLPAFASEREMLPLLRVVLSPRRILLLKWVAQGGYLSFHALLYVLAGLVIREPLGLAHRPVAGALLEGMGFALLGSLLGVCIGLLLPGRVPTGAPGSGSSAAGTLLYSLLVGSAIVVWGSAQYLHMSTGFDAADLMVTALTIAIALLLSALAIGAWGLSHLNRSQL